MAGLKPGTQIFGDQKLVSRTIIVFRTILSLVKEEELTNATGIDP